MTRHPWAVILAGGDGVRLRSMTRGIAGDDRPKQFCALVGDEALSSEPRRRAALAVPAHRILVVVNRPTSASTPRCSPICACPRWPLSPRIGARLPRSRTRCCSWPGDGRARIR
jgi:hypothetical protein